MTTNTVGNTDSVGLSNSTAPSMPDCVGAGVRIRGEISGSNDLLVEGNVEGPIQLPGHSLTIGVNGKIASEVVAREIVVHGSVKGNMRASERIEIRKNGSVIGNLTTARILIEDGASFKGSIEIDRDAVAIPEKPMLVRAASASGQAQRAKSG
jgi:cytoskeletal protein CcmA (bactofilin family)